MTTYKWKAPKVEKVKCLIQGKWWIKTLLQNLMITHKSKLVSRSK